jgi:hypothetical protein
MDKELNHFVEALLVSATNLSTVPLLNVYVSYVHSAVASHLESA